MSRSYRRKKRLFYSRLAEIQKAHKPDKHEARNSYNWKKEWGPFIKYDADWDGAYFLDLVIYKLEKMYAELDIFSDEIRETLDPKLVKLKEAIDLGKKIQTYDYYKESHDFSHEHTTHYVLIYKHKNTEVVGKGKLKIQLYKDEELLYKMPRPKMKNLDEEVEYEIKTKDWMGFGYDKKDIHLASSGEWDDPKNHDEWLKIMDEESKTEQKDIDDFFQLIARNYREWWW